MEVVDLRVGCVASAYEPPFCENAAARAIAWRICRVEQPIRDKRFLPAVVFRGTGVGGGVDLAVAWIWPWRESRRGVDLAVAGICPRRESGRGGNLAAARDPVGCS